MFLSVVEPVQGKKEMKGRIDYSMYLFAARGRTTYMRDKISVDNTFPRNASST